LASTDSNRHQLIPVGISWVLQESTYYSWHQQKPDCIIWFPLASAESSRYQLTPAGIHWFQFTSDASSWDQLTLGDIQLSSADSS
jgi:hypothetical protein